MRFRSDVFATPRARLTGAPAAPRRLLVGAALAMCAALAACGDATPPTEVVSANEAVVGGAQRLVNMMDACDPASFGAVNVTCTRAGGVTFERFLGLLREHRSVGAWRFAPGTIHAGVGQTLVAVNRGGEVHTFTEVEHYGGGIIDVLNVLSGTPVPAPECLNLTAGDFIAPGGTDTDEVEQPGVEHYQCCIHPWMRLDVHTAS
jgi:plastocyanin